MLRYEFKAAAAASGLQSIKPSDGVVGR